jgi:hypothetical protein
MERLKSSKGLLLLCRTLHGSACLDTKPLPTVQTCGALLHSHVRNLHCLSAAQCAGSFHFKQPPPHLPRPPLGFTRLPLYLTQLPLRVARVHPPLPSPDDIIAHARSFAGLPPAAAAAAAATRLKAAIRGASARSRAWSDSGADGAAAPREALRGSALVWETQRDILEALMM